MLRKAFRGFAVALILMPEPVTTAIGLIILGMAFLLSLSRRLSSRPYLRRLIKFYLNQTSPHSQPARIIHHSLKERLASYDADWQRPPAKEVTRHVIDDERLQRRYAAQLEKVGLAIVNKIASKSVTAGDAIRHSLASRWSNYDWPRQAVATSDLTQVRADKTRPTRYPYGEAIVSRKGTTPQAIDKVIYHALKSNLSGYVLPSVPLAPEKAVQHTIDMVKLQGYYGRVLAERESERFAAEGKPKTPERIILRRATQIPPQARTAVRPRVSVLRAQPVFS